MTAPDFPPEVIEKAAQALCEAMGMNPDHWPAWKWEATAVLTAVSDDLIAKGARQVYEAVGRAEARNLDPLVQAYIRGHNDAADAARAAFIRIEKGGE